MKYKPLPFYLTIKQSQLHGLGLFSLTEIPKDTTIGMTHIEIENDLIRTPLGGFINHSEDNNCELFVKEDWDDYIIFNIKTIKNIDKNNEILLNYDL